MEPTIYGTSFFKIYCRFLDKITDEMYMELTLDETMLILDSLFMDSLSEFDWPRFRIGKFNTELVTSDALGEDGTPIVTGAFEDTLTGEEEDILAEIMLNKWFRRQLSSTKLTQMRYSTSDFKQTSQAAHLQRLDSLIRSHDKTIYRKQRMYQRRITNEDGFIVPNYDGLSGVDNRNRGKILTQIGEVKRNVR